MFEFTSHGVNFTTILRNQAHTCNTLLLHASSCCRIKIPPVFFFGFREECGRNDATTTCCKFSFAIDLLHFWVGVHAGNGDGFAV